MELKITKAKENKIYAIHNKEGELVVSMQDKRSKWRATKMFYTQKGWAVSNCPLGCDVVEYVPASEVQ